MPLPGATTTSPSTPRLDVVPCGPHGQRPLRADTPGLSTRPASTSTRRALWAHNHLLRLPSTRPRPRIYHTAQKKCRTTVPYRPHAQRPRSQLLSAQYPTPPTQLPNHTKNAERSCLVGVTPSARAASYCVCPAPNPAGAATTPRKKNRTSTRNPPSPEI